MGCHFFIQCLSYPETEPMSPVLAGGFFTGEPPGKWRFTFSLVQFSSVQSLSCVQLFATPWIAVCQASLSITNSRSLLKLRSIESVMRSSHLILCHPLVLLPPIPPSVRVFSNESTLHMRWPKYWSFSFSISPSNEHPGLISFRMDWLDLSGENQMGMVFKLSHKCMICVSNCPANILQRPYPQHALLFHQFFIYINYFALYFPITRSLCDLQVFLL